MNNNKNNIVIKLTILGFVLGLVFTISALIIYFSFNKIPFLLNNVISIHKQNPIYFFVDSVPVIFAIIAFFVGRIVKKKYELKLQNLVKETEKLNQEISAKSIEAEEAKEKISNSIELLRSQAALAEILRNVTGEERSLEQFLQDALEKLLNLSWLSVLSKGSIFLKNKEGNLEMIAEKDLGEVAVRCALIKPGECLCGKALSEKKMQYCNHIDHKHEITFENMQEHGHYNIPIIMHEEVLGVLNIYTEHNHKKTDFEVQFLQTVCDTLASVINRKKTQHEILKAKEELEIQRTDLEKKNKAIRKYSVQMEQQSNERESLNQMILAQKKKVEIKNKESEEYSKKLEKQAKEQEKISQKLFAQNLEVEQRNFETEEYAKKLEKQAKEQEELNQKLFAQKLEVEQRNFEVELYSKQIEKHNKEQESLNQKLFAQKLEVEQRNLEAKQHSEQLEKQAKEQDKLNQKLFAQKLEVEQRNLEAKQYSEQLEKQAKEQEALNQKLFAQKLEVEQRNMEVELYTKQVEDQKVEQDKLNQKLFAQSLEVDQKRIEIERYSTELEIQKNKAENAFKHINDSINYSKYIQESLLPSVEEIKRYFIESFVYFKPKETIGGDFYYFKKIKNNIIFAVADCTGHGVPGALLSMLSIALIDNIVVKKFIDTPGIALDVLRQKIKDTFKSYGDNIQNKNGLDIAFCSLDTKTNILSFSGAFNPLYLYRNSELIEIKATRNPIGFYPVEKEFETVDIKLQKDDVIYLFSDGYQDQLGGEKGRKFSKRQFRTMLSEIHKYPMQKQKIFIEKIMQKWQANQQQVDDMTIMGLKFDK